MEKKKKVTSGPVFCGLGLKLRMLWFMNLVNQHIFASVLGCDDTVVNKMDIFCSCGTYLVVWE